MSRTDAGRRLSDERRQHCHRRAHQAGPALGVDLDNHDAVCLYLRLGFVEWPFGPVHTMRVEYLPNGGIRVPDLSPPADRLPDPML
jgi:hypothetical protein